MELIGILATGGLATAFVLSTLVYVTNNPLIRALAGLLTSFGSIALVYGLVWADIPLTAGATFLGVLLFARVPGGDTPQQTSRLQRRIPRL